MSLYVLKTMFRSSQNSSLTEELKAHDYLNSHLRYFRQKQGKINKSGIQNGRNALKIQRFQRVS